MPANPYDDCMVALWRPHGNGDLEIVRSSYTPRKANVIEAYMMRIHVHTFNLFMTRLLSLKALTDQNKLASLR